MSCIRARRRYVQKVEDFSKETYSRNLDPYNIDDSECEDNITRWPPVDFGSLYTYLIDTVGVFTRENLKAYKSLEAYNYYARYAGYMYLTWNFCSYI